MNEVIVSKNNYYPFGLRHNGYNDLQAGTQGSKFKYNGKELNDELGLDWYDFGAINYDVALGRWMNIDPLAEQMRRYSPYNYAFDNPIRFIDPEGESFAIESTVMNFLNEGGSSQLSTLDDIIMFDNNFMRGATQKAYSDYLKSENKNSKYEIAVIINALSGGEDKSNGANGWDGLNLY